MNLACHFLNFCNISVQLSPLGHKRPSLHTRLGPFALRLCLSHVLGSLRKGRAALTRLTHLTLIGPNAPLLAHRRLWTRLPGALQRHTNQLIHGLRHLQFTRLGIFKRRDGHLLLVGESLRFYRGKVLLMLMLTAKICVDELLLLTDLGQIHGTHTKLIRPTTRLQNVTHTLTLFCSI